MINYQRIIKDCFWDENISEKEIDSILNSSDFRRKSFLFEKILLNSTRLFLDLSIFGIIELKKFLEEYRVPAFNRDFIFRRKNLAEVYFLDKPLLIDDLKWKI